MALYNRKLTPEVQKIIVKCLENGLSIAGACGKAKINRTTFYDWYNKGAEAKSGKMKEFHDAVDNAKDTAQANFESVIANASVEKWQAAAWWLQHRRRDMYNQPDKIIIHPKERLDEFVEDKTEKDEIFKDV